MTSRRTDQRRLAKGAGEHLSSEQLTAVADDRCDGALARVAMDHLQGCDDCAEKAASQRLVRSLLSQVAPTTGASARLHDQLRGIAGSQADAPLWLSANGSGRLPSPRRVRRQRALTSGSLMALACALMLGAGWLLAPALPEVSNASRRANSEYDVTTGTGAVAQALTAVQTAPDGSFDARRAVQSPHLVPSNDWVRVSPEVVRSLLRERPRAYTGVQRVMLGSRSDYLQANVQVTQRSGEPVHLAVLAHNGRVLSAGYVSGTGEPILPPAAASFRMSVGGQIAGQTTQLIEARRADGSLLARWWVSPMLNLVMWAEVFDPDGELMRSAGFVQFTPSTLVAEPDTIDTLQLSRAPATVSSSSICAAGFSCASELAGLPLLQMSTDSPAQPTIVHAVYGAGDVRVSVVQQRGRLVASEAERTGYGVSSDRAVASWQSGEIVYTVATNGGQAVAASAIAQLPHQQPVDDGTWHKTRAGLKQLFGR